MHPQRKQRIYSIFIILLGIFIAIVLVLVALSRNIDLFYSPTDIYELNIENGVKIRAGGMVKEGSFSRKNGTLDVSFILTDFNNSIKVIYSGILPNLFSENSGVVIKGSLDKNGNFLAFEILAKHDENYMPPEVLKSLNKEDYDS